MLTTLNIKVKTMCDNVICYLYKVVYNDFDDDSLQGQ